MLSLNVEGSSIAEHVLRRCNDKFGDKGITVYTYANNRLINLFLYPQYCCTILNYNYRLFLNQIFLLCIQIVCIVHLNICDWLWENPPGTHKDNYLEKRN